MPNVSTPHEYTPLPHTHTHTHTHTRTHTHIHKYTDCTYASAVFASEVFSVDVEKQKVMGSSAGVKSHNHLERMLN